MIRVLLVDDHALFRAALRSVLHETKDIKVTGEAETGEIALEKARELSPDLILMDIKMPGMGGLETTRRLFQQNPDNRILMVTAFDHDPFPNQLLNAGAKGFISKNCQADEFFIAIRTVMVGNLYLSNKVAQQIALNRTTGRDDAKKNPFNALSAREMQVMLMIVQGRSNPTICEALFLSPKTISTYRRRLYDKLDVNNDVELTHLALSHHVI